jgi:hypothetical protein
MKNGAAVVVGALVMFVSGYILGYTTAVPDMLRASALDIPEGEMSAMDDEMVIDVTDTIGAGNPGDGVSGPDEQTMNNQLQGSELEELKKMIVPMLTDEEIKKIREEAAAASADK